jgi:glycosyltransferase involved in cell wall biosynthesis
MTPRISVIIPTHNRAAVLGHSLRTVLAQTLEPSRYEVIVIDDGSSDDTEDVVQTLDDPRIIFRAVRHGGASAARNHALGIARGELVVFLDDDAFIAPDFLVQHARCHSRGTRRLVAGAIVEVRELPGPMVPSGLTWRGYHRHPSPGGNSSARLDDLRRIGGFDERFSSYGWQDQEMGERLLASGVTRRFAWRAPIYHYKDPADVADVRRLLAQELQRGRMGARFYHRHRRFFVGVTTKMWPPLQALDRILAQPLGLETAARRILAGELIPGDVSPRRLALLRAHVEMSAGRDEWAHLTVPPNVHAERASDAPFPPLPNEPLSADGQDGTLASSDANVG